MVDLERFSALGIAESSMGYLCKVLAIECWFDEDFRFCTVAIVFEYLVVEEVGAGPGTDVLEASIN